jgi:hypothetical protein
MIMSHPPVTDASWRAVMQLAVLEQDGFRCVLNIGPFGAFAILGAVQLTLTHEEVGPQLRPVLEQLGRDIGRDIEESLAELGIEGLAQVMDQGWRR